MGSSQLGGWYIFSSSGLFESTVGGGSVLNANSEVSGVACVLFVLDGCETWLLQHFQFFSAAPCSLTFFPPQESDNIGGSWSEHSPEKPVSSSGDNRGGSFELALLGGHQQDDCRGNRHRSSSDFPNLSDTIESGGCKDLQNDIVQISCAN